MPKPLTALTIEAAAKIKWLLTDVDDTLTLNGQLPAPTLQALQALQTAGINVVAVTGACAGWCDQFAKLWPLHTVIGENGAFYMQSQGKQFVQHFTKPLSLMQSEQKTLLAQLSLLLKDYPGVEFATDQAFRFCDVAIDIAQYRDRLPQSQINALLLKINKMSVNGQRVNATASSIHINVWLGQHNKRSASAELLQQYGVDIRSDQVLYVGDSPNDQPLFEVVKNSIGVANISDYLAQLTVAPQFITSEPGGKGFFQVAEHLLTAQLK